MASKEYKVDFTIPVNVRVTVEIDRDDFPDLNDDQFNDFLIEEASEYAYLRGYAGNGGNDKLVGTANENVSLDPWEFHLEGKSNSDYGPTLVEEE